MISPSRHSLIPRKQNANGSALLLAVLLIAVAGVMCAAWVTLITARSGMVGQMTAASQRRIALENSKALAQEFMLERVLPSTSGVAFSYNLADPAWGGISVPAWGSTPMVSVQKAAGVNHFNPGNGDGYTFDLNIVVNNGDNNPTRRYQIKSRAPAFAGTLLTSQTPTLTPTALLDLQQLSAAGEAFIWRPAVSMSFFANSYSTPDGVTAITVTNSGGTALAMSNMALPRLIANPRSGGTAFYTGQLDAINNSSPAANSSTAKATDGSGITVLGSVVSSTGGVSCDGDGHVTVILNTAALGNVYIPGEISTLTLEGQATANDVAADDLPALLIVVDQAAASTRDLASVTFDLHNNRRFNLAIKKAASTGSLPLQFSTASATWRLLLEAENTPILFTSTGLNLRGGIRSDRSVTVSTGNANLIYEDDPKYLERLATRAAWVESFEQ